VFDSAIFLKKIGSGMHSDPKFSPRGGDVHYVDARKKRFCNALALQCIIVKWNKLKQSSLVVLCFSVW
jgi:hypothetical protein